MRELSWFHPFGNGIDREARNTPDLLKLFQQDAKRLARPGHNMFGPKKTWTEEETHTYLTAHLRFLLMLARQYHGRLEVLDAVQEGYFGLWRAAHSYDPEKSKYLTYAWHWIRSKITRAEANLAQPIRCPAHLIVAARKIYHQRESLAQQTGRNPSLTDVAEVFDISVASVGHLLILPYARTIHPDQCLINVEELGDVESMWSGISDPSCISPELLLMAREEFGEILKTIERMLRYAKRHEHSAMPAFIQYYGLDRGAMPRTLEQVGAMRCRTRERVRQLLEKVWSTLSPHFPYDRYEPWLVGLSERVADLEDAVGQVVDFTTALQTVIAPYMIIKSPAEKKDQKKEKYVAIRKKFSVPTQEDLDLALTIMQQHLHQLANKMQQVVRLMYGLDQSVPIGNVETVAVMMGTSKESVRQCCYRALHYFRAVGLPSHIRHSDIIKHIRFIASR